MLHYHKKVWDQLMLSCISHYSQRNWPELFSSNTGVMTSTICRMPSERNRRQNGNWEPDVMVWQTFCLNRLSFLCSQFGKWVIVPPFPWCIWSKRAVHRIRRNITLSRDADENDCHICMQFLVTRTTEQAWEHNPVRSRCIIMRNCRRTIALDSKPWIEDETYL